MSIRVAPFHCLHRGRLMSDVDVEALDQVLCRTCMRPITHETRTEPGYLPREGWYDDCRSDPIVCFKALDYRHVPLTARERAYYEAGFRAGRAALPAPEPTP